MNPTISVGSDTRLIACALAIALSQLVAPLIDKTPGVRVSDGLAALTVMPYFQRSAAIPRVRPIAPILLALYAAPFSVESCTESDVMFTMRPHPRSSMEGTNAWLTKNFESRLIEMTLRHDIKAQVIKDVSREYARIVDDDVALAEAPERCFSKACDIGGR
nr:hypothetical protein [Polaromonas glacialis]